MGVKTCRQKCCFFVDQNPPTCALRISTEFKEDSIQSTYFPLICTNISCIGVQQILHEHIIVHAYCDLSIQCKYIYPHEIYIDYDTNEICTPVFYCWRRFIDSTPVYSTSPGSIQALQIGIDYSLREGPVLGGSFRGRLQDITGLLVEVGFSCTPLQANFCVPQRSHCQ